MPSHRPLSSRSSKRPPEARKSDKNTANTQQVRFFKLYFDLMYFRRKTADYFRSNFSSIQLTIILRNRAEYHLILSRRGRRPSWLNQGIFRKIEQDNCFIIQQIPIDYHFQNEKNYGSMIKTLKASNT